MSSQVALTNVDYGSNALNSSTRMNLSMRVAANQVAGFIAVGRSGFRVNFDGKGSCFLGWAPLNINKSFGIVIIRKLRDGWVGGRRGFKFYDEWMDGW